MSCQIIYFVYSPSFNITYINDLTSFPNHICPEITFNLDLTADTPKTIAVVNKISFRDTTIYLQDALSMHWKYSPVVIVATPGKYSFTFPGVNDSMQHWRIAEAS